MTDLSKLEADGAVPVAWQPRYKQNVIDHLKSLGGEVWDYAMMVSRTEDEARNYGTGDHEVRPLYPASVVQRLIEERDEARAERDRLERNRDMWRGQCERQSKVIEEMRVELGDMGEKLHQDTERLKEAETIIAPFADISDLVDSETEGLSDEAEVYLRLEDYFLQSLQLSVFRAARAWLKGRGK